MLKSRDWSRSRDVSRPSFNGLGFGLSGCGLGLGLGLEACGLGLEKFSLTTPEGWKAELANLANPQPTVCL